MPASAEIPYLDTSAAVKLLLHERESAALRRWLRQRPRRASSALLRVEVVRAIRRAGLPGLLPAARRLVAGMHLLRISDPLLEAAADLDPATMRSLDAVHLAAARSLGLGLGSIVTYDARMIEAARALGLPVISPGVRA